jgi:hypothetical protein
MDPTIHRPPWPNLGVVAKRRVWVLDTETKGTGAQMVPLDSVLDKPAPSAKPFVVPPKPRPRPKREPEPRAPRRFRVIDVTTREHLADDATARETVEVLGRVRSNVDVNVFVWAEKAQTWRLLSLAEQRALWDRRRPASGH